MENNIQISPDCSLGEISFEQFQGWFNMSISKVKLEIVNQGDILEDFKEEFTKQNAVLKKEIDKQKKYLEKANNEITT